MEREKLYVRHSSYSKHAILQSRVGGAVLGAQKSTS